jgi:integrase
MKTRTGYLYQKNGSPNWYLTWRVGQKTFTRTLRKEDGAPATTRRDAEQARKKIMEPFRLGDEVTMLENISGKLQGRKAELQKLEDAQNPPLEIVKAWTAFIDSANRPDTGPDTLAVYEGQFGQFVDWIKEKHPEITALRDVGTAVAAEYAGHLGGMINQGRLTANTYNKHLNMLMLVFRVLQPKARMIENPWNHPKKGGAIPRKALTTRTRRELTVDELRKVCQSASAGEMRTLFALGVYTGLRLYDCATLRWGETDLRRNVIVRIPHKISRKQHAQPVHIPIHPVLHDILSETTPANRGEYVLPRTAAAYTGGGAGKKRVIDSIQDHFISQGVKVYAPGTGPGTGKRAVVEVGFHSLRHSFVSICRESDVPLAVVEAIVGHSNPAMTRHYTHTGALHARQAVAALPCLIGEAKPQELGKPSAEAILAQIRGILESVTANNWNAKHAEVLVLIKGGQLNAKAEQ